MAGKLTNPKASKVSNELYITIDYSFYVHPKIRLLLSLFGPAGPYIIQLLWRQMYVRNGYMDDSNDFELISVSEDSKSDLETVKKVIEKSLEMGLLSRGKKQNYLYSEEVLHRLKVRLGDKEFYSRMGRLGADKRWSKNSPPIAPLLPGHSPAIASKEVSNKVTKEVMYVSTFTSVSVSGSNYPIATHSDRDGLLRAVLSEKFELSVEEINEDLVFTKTNTEEFLKADGFPERIQLLAAATREQISTIASNVNSEYEYGYQEILDRIITKTNQPK